MGASMWRGLDKVQWLGVAMMVASVATLGVILITGW